MEMVWKPEEFIIVFDRKGENLLEIIETESVETEWTGIEATE